MSMSDVFVMAVAASLDAGLLAAAVILLGRPRPAQKLLAYLIGAMGFSVLFGLLIVFALHGTTLLKGPATSTTAVVEVVAGSALLITAAAVLGASAVRGRSRRPTEGGVQRQPRWSLSSRVTGHDSVCLAWAAGAAYSAPGAYYLAGLALLAKLNAPAMTNVLTIVAFNLIMFALIELPLLGFVLAPDRTRSLTSRLNGWVSRRRRALIVIVAGAGGAFLLLSGLAALG
jgi:hypothetical protein